MSTNRPVFDPASGMPVFEPSGSHRPVFAEPSTRVFIVAAGSLTYVPVSTAETCTPSGFGHANEEVWFDQGVGAPATWMATRLRLGATIWNDYLWRILVPPDETDSGLWEVHVGIAQSVGSLNYADLKTAPPWYLKTTWTSDTQWGVYDYSGTVGLDAGESDDITDVEVTRT